MEIQEPQWHLSQLRCPCGACDEGALELRACPSCGAVVAVCSDTDGAFLDPRPISITASAAMIGEDSQCPGCGSVSLGAFGPAQTEQILRARHQAG